MLHLSNNYLIEVQLFACVPITNFANALFTGRTSWEFPDSIIMVLFLSFFFQSKDEEYSNTRIILSVMEFVPSPHCERTGYNST
jgi:hypothetical protein